MSATLWIAIASVPLWGFAIWLRRARIALQADLAALEAFDAWDGEPPAESAADPLRHLREGGAL